VRELWNVVQRAHILGKEEIGPEALALPLEAPVERTGERTGAPTLEVRVGSAISDVEQQLILATLESTGGDKKKSAEILGISLKTLYNRLSVYAAARRGAASEQATRAAN
jgi:DNA-binding NtrC family response regulator